MTNVTQDDRHPKTADRCLAFLVRASSWRHTINTAPRFEGNRQIYCDEIAKQSVAIRLVARSRSRSFETPLVVSRAADICWDYRQFSTRSINECAWSQFRQEHISNGNFATNSSYVKTALISVCGSRRFAAKFEDLFDGNSSIPMLPRSFVDRYFHFPKRRRRLWQVESSLLDLCSRPIGQSKSMTVWWRIGSTLSCVLTESYFYNVDCCSLFRWQRELVLCTDTRNTHWRKTSSVFRLQHVL